MMNTEKKIRVRFAPSPTGGLHLGGVRTALYNYLFAKKNNGDFILRIEDTDQTRFVEGAEEYIYDVLNWAGIPPNESPALGGNFGPYKQNERKNSYKKYALELVEKGLAYYAFDTPEALEEKRKSIPNFQYNYTTRNAMKNSLTMDKASVAAYLESGKPYVIRLKVEPFETIHLDDMIRGKVSFQTENLDDKILLKADGFPTYHLAVVVDDFLMQITQVFRGEEWLPSAPIHYLLWKYLFGLENMPQWAHLPLILKPDGNGKLSKRDGDRLNFPVFAMNWVKAEGGFNKGFKEMGFLPEAFVNMLALIGWHQGLENEILSKEDLIHHFSVEKIHKAGAKFDYEKAKWINGEWIKKMDNPTLKNYLIPFLEAENIPTAAPQLEVLIGLVKDRCQLLTDFVPQLKYFFHNPETIDTASIESKWTTAKKVFFENLMTQFERCETWTAENIEKTFQQTALDNNLKPNEVLLPFRIMLVGGKFGPNVFLIAEFLGEKSCVKRIKNGLKLLA